MINLRPSSMPRLFACPGSLNYAEWEDPDGIQGTEASQFGTEVHKLLADQYPCFSGRIVPEDPEMARCVSNGIEMVNTLCDNFSMSPILSESWDGINFEVDNFDVGIAGTCDLILEKQVQTNVDSSDNYLVIDYKTTRRPDESLSPRRQCQAYSAISGFNCKSVVLWLRDGTYEVYDPCGENTEDFFDEIIEHVLAHNDEFRPGVACNYCPGRNVCEFRHNAARSVLAILEHPERDITPYAMASAYPKIKQLRKMLDDYDKAIDIALADCPNGILTPDGLLKRTAFTKDEIDAALAWPVLERNLSDEELASVISVGKTKLLEAVAAKAPRGAKDGAKKAILQELNAAGAISKTEYYRKSFEVTK